MGRKAIDFNVRRWGSEVDGGPAVSSQVVLVKANTLGWACIGIGFHPLKRVSTPQPEYVVIYQKDNT